MFRLIVDLPLEVALAIDELAGAYHTNQAETVRLAIATELLLHREEKAGGTLILRRRGRRYRFRRPTMRSSAGASSVGSEQSVQTLVVPEVQARSPEETSEEGQT
jgi:hypothetical protein